MALLQEHGEFKEAKALHLEVLQASRATLGDVHPETIRSMNNVAVLLQDQGH